MNSHQEVPCCAAAVLNVDMKFHTFPLVHILVYARLKIQGEYPFDGPPCSVDCEERQQPVNDRLREQNCLGLMWIPRTKANMKNETMKFSIAS